MNLFKKNVIGSILALGVVSAFIAVVFALALGYVTIPDSVRDYFNMSLGALISFASTAIGYFLGSSRGSAEKTDLMAGKMPQV